MIASTNAEVRDLNEGARAHSQGRRPLRQRPDFRDGARYRGHLAKMVDMSHRKDTTQGYELGREGTRIYERFSASREQLAAKWKGIERQDHGQDGKEVEKTKAYEHKHDYDRDRGL